MRWPSLRRDPLTARVRAELPAGERVVAVAAYDDDGVLAATDVALWDLPAGAAPDRMFWDEIDVATWRDGILRVIELASTAVREWRVSEPRLLPVAVRDRVTASVVVSSHQPLARGGGVRVVARQRYAEEGLRWRLVFDRPADAGDPLLRAEAEQRLAEVRASVG